jgi:hypothetical protein
MLNVLEYLRKVDRCKRKMPLSTNTKSSTWKHTELHSWKKSKNLRIQREVQETTWGHPDLWVERGREDRADKNQ